MIPATVLTVILADNVQITAETTKSPPELRALMNEPDEEKIIRVPTINAGGKVDKRGELVFQLINEEISFKLKHVRFFSIAETKAPSDLILPKPGLVR